MSGRAVAAVRAARKAAAYLAQVGQHKRANDVLRVCRSNEAYRGTLQLLHRDNMMLRPPPTDPSADELPLCGC